MFSLIIKYTNSFKNQSGEVFLNSGDNARFTGEPIT